MINFSSAIIFAKTIQIDKRILLSSNIIHVQGFNISLKAELQKNTKEQKLWGKKLSYNIARLCFVICKQICGAATRLSFT